MDNTPNLKRIRIGLMFWILVFSAFGLFDTIMLPVNYRSALFIRFAVVVPFMLIAFIISFTPFYLKWRKIIVLSLLSICQTGLLAMIYIARPEEAAFAHYHIGIIIIVLSSGFLLQVSLKPSTWFFFGSLLAYILIMIFRHGLLTDFSNFRNIGYFFGNTSVILLLGSLYLLGLARLQKSRDEAEYANQVKTAFLANISHEIRTPLNGITGCARLLVEPDIPEASRTRYEEIINFCSNQLMDIVDSILLMSEIETRKSELNLESVSLIKTCEDLVKQFAFIAEQKKLKFVYECLIPDEKDIFITDLQKFRMIISNLLNNAVKFTSEGAVTVRGGFISDKLRIIIEDTGIGIAEAQLEHIFDSFYQTDRGYSREFGGNGLGLAICKSYTEMLKGTIAVESTVGKGSTFIITLPALS